MAIARGPVTAIPANLGKQRFDLGYALHAAGGEKRATRFLERLLAQLVACHVTCARETKHELRSIRLIGRRQHERFGVVPDGCPVGVERERTVAGLAQRDACARVVIASRQARCSPELERAHVVVREHL